MDYVNDGYPHPVNAVDLKPAKESSNFVGALSRAEEVAAKEKAEAEYWCKNQDEVLAQFTQGAQAGTLGRGTLKARQDALCAAVEGGKAPQVQNCAAMAPEGYEAQRQALLADLRKRHEMAIQRAMHYQASAAADRAYADNLSRAINLVTLNPYNELLMELMNLKVL